MFKHFQNEVAEEGTEILGMVVLSVSIHPPSVKTS